MRKTPLIAAATFALALTACAENKYDNDPYYDVGFSDGCATGTARSPGTPASKPVRDQKTWDESEAYRAGWKSGYGACTPGGRGGNIPGSDRDMGGR
jgi:hypothetical protein